MRWREQKKEKKKELRCVIILHVIYSVYTHEEGKGYQKEPPQPEERRVTSSRIVPLRQKVKKIKCNSYLTRYYSQPPAWGTKERK